MKKHIIAIIFLYINIITAQNLIVHKVDNSSYAGKAMFGYQGWFSHPDDNSPQNWYGHWGNLDIVDIDHLEVDMYPDLREYGEDEKYSTAYTLPNGENAKFFSSGNRQTVLRHMKWVRDYNTDGVFLQRFINENDNWRKMAHKDSVTVSVMKGCELYGRIFSIMYDGIPNNVQWIKNDWKHLVDVIGITQSDRYLHHDGLPLVALWGYASYSDATPDELEELIEFFHNNPEPKYRASIKLGTGDFRAKPEWFDAFSKVEVISPWSVGGYKQQSEYTNHLNNRIIPDKNWCTERGILYVPVLYPGFSWHNLRDGEAPQNHYPRDGGNLFWMQVKGAMENNVESFYFAMLDEVDEGTAYFKTAENSEQAPAQGFWLNLDADGYNLPSDWYLRSAGKAAETLRGNLDLTPLLGTPNEGIMTMRYNPDYCSVIFIFPDFENESRIEFSFDGGLTFPYSIPDDHGEYEVKGLAMGEHNIFVRHPNSEAVPMGKIQISYSCTDMVKDHNLSAVKAENFTDRLPLHVTNFNPEFIMQNDGKNEEFDIPVSCEISLDNEIVYSKTKTIDQISAFEKRPVTFDFWQPSDNNTYDLIFFIGLPNDEEPSSDTIKSTITLSNMLDDFESEFELWTTNKNWGVDDRYAYGGLYCMAINPGTKYEHKTDSYAEYKYTFDLTSMDNPYLTFWSRTDTKGNDHGFVEISSDGGLNWTQISEDYKGSHINWEQKILSLQDYADYDSISIRFHFISDMMFNATGWFIDNIRLEDCVTSISEDDLGILPEKYKLYDNYPNPFNPETIIQYSIPKNINVEINVYDLIGNKIKTLVNEHKLAGSYSLNFDASGLPSGIYIYQITAGDFSVTKKMLLMK